jgi:hypothetical protein
MVEFTTLKLNGLLESIKILGFFIMSKSKYSYFSKRPKSILLFVKLLECLILICTTILGIGICLVDHEN